MVGSICLLHPLVFHLVEARIEISLYSLLRLLKVELRRLLGVEVAMPVVRRGSQLQNTRILVYILLPVGLVGRADLLTALLRG